MTPPIRVRKGARDVVTDFEVQSTRGIRHCRAPVRELVGKPSIHALDDAPSQIEQIARCLRLLDDLAEESSRIQWLSRRR
jgi:hypothetical protein